MAGEHIRTRPKTSRSSEIQGLRRGLGVLTYLNAHDGATVAEIARGARLARTTTVRLLNTLRELGFLVRGPDDRRFRLTVQVRTLADGYDDEAWVTDIARPYILALGERVVWPLFLSTMMGTSMLIRFNTDRISPLAIQRFAVGLRIPLLESASGRLFLANCSREQREMTLRILCATPEADESLIRDRARIDRLLNDARQRRYAFYQRAELHNENALAVPVQANGRILASLAMRFTYTAMTESQARARFLAPMLETARQIGLEFWRRTHPQGLPSYGGRIGAAKPRR